MFNSVTKFDYRYEIDIVNNQHLIIKVIFFKYISLKLSLNKISDCPNKQSQHCKLFNNSGSSTSYSGASVAALLTFFSPHAMASGGQPPPPPSPQPLVNPSPPS